MTSLDMFSGPKFRVFMLELLFLVSSVLCAPKCNERDLMFCMEELKPFTSNQDLAFAQTEEELSRTCGHLQDAMKCVNDFTIRCLDKSQVELYKQMTQGAQSLLKELCTDGSQFRNEYLTHASCYKNLSSDYRQCADNFLTQKESAKRENLSTQERVRKSCCLFDGYRVCARNAVEEKCNVAAARLGEQIITKAGGTMVEFHCERFKHNSDECVLASSSGSFLSSFPLYVILIVIASISFDRFHLL